MKIQIELDVFAGEVQALIDAIERRSTRLWKLREVATARGNMGPAAIFEQEERLLKMVRERLERAREAAHEAKQRATNYG